MLSNKDIAIKETVTKEKTMDTFYKKVLVDVHDIEYYHCEDCYESALDAICHIWQGPKTAKGYGVFNIYSKKLGKRLNVYAHRLAYEYAFNELPIVARKNNNMLVVNHMCHNRACVNPMHLELITGSENSSRDKRKPKNGYNRAS